MVKFWDSSALVPLLVQDTATTLLEKLASQDRDMYVWWSTELECVSAISRLERERKRADLVAQALDRLSVLASRWDEVIPGTAVREAARRLLRVHPLRASDALQLAAAVVFADQNPSAVEFLSLDDRLRDAAAREGFRVLP